MSLFVFPIMSYLSQMVVVIPISLYFDRMGKNLKFLSAYLVLAMVVDTLQFILAMRHIDNRWTSQWFLPVQFILLVLVYNYSKDHDRTLFRLVGPLGLFALCYAFTLVHFYPIPRWFAYVKPTTALIIVILSCKSLIELIKHSSEPIGKEPMFWVSSANLLYFAGTAILYGLSKEIFSSSLEVMRIAWSTQSVVNVASNILYIRGFLCFRSK